MAVLLPSAIGIWRKAASVAPPDSSQWVQLTVHFQVTAESNATITGYVIYVDRQNVFRNFSPSLDAWVMLPPGATHWLQIKAWDSAGSVLSSVAYSIYVQGTAPPIPPIGASRLIGIANTTSAWTVDNNNDVGGQCNNGSIGAYASASDPNTLNAPNTNGQHFHLASSADMMTASLTGSRPRP